MTRTYAFTLIINYRSIIDNIEFDLFTALLQKEQERDQEYAYIVMDEFKN